MPISDFRPRKAVRHDRQRSVTRCGDSHDIATAIKEARSIPSPSLQPRLGHSGFTENDMAKRPMTNLEKVTHIMTFSNYGALAQCFVMDALHKWSDLVRKASSDNISNGFISGEAWIGVANEIHDRLNTEMLINDPESNEDEL
jgi:hypothetical protein